MSPYRHGRRGAKRLRGEWQLGDGPVKDIFLLLDEHGIETVRWPMESQVSGCLANVPEIGTLIFINTNRTRGHQVFTAAHELFHYRDDPAKPFRWEDLKASGRKPDVEKSADAFAADFLMPFTGIRAVLDEMEISSKTLGVDDVIRLQMRFGVSYEAMVYRLRDMSQISDRHRGRLLNEEHPARRALELGYSEKEIFGEPGPVVPKRFRRLALNALLQGRMSRRRFQTLLGMNEETFTQVMKEAGLGHHLAEKDEWILEQF